MLECEQILNPMLMYYHKIIVIWLFQVGGLTIIISSSTISLVIWLSIFDHIVKLQQHTLIRPAKSPPEHS